MWIANGYNGWRKPSRVQNLTEGIAMLRKLIYGLAALATALSLSACNTVNGMGKDVEKGGQKIQEESKEVEHKM
jgi:entericidin B